MNLLVMTLELVHTLEAIFSAIFARYLRAGKQFWFCAMLDGVVTFQIGPTVAKEIAALHRTATTNFPVGTEPRREEMLGLRPEADTVRTLTVCNATKLELANHPTLDWSTSRVKAFKLCQHAVVTAVSLADEADAAM